MEDEALLINRYGCSISFLAFLKKYQLQKSYNLLLALAGENTWSGLLACKNNLLHNHQIVFERKPVRRTVVHSLDFKETAEFNREPRNISFLKRA